MCNSWEQEQYMYFKQRLVRRLFAEQTSITISYCFADRWLTTMWLGTLPLRSSRRHKDSIPGFPEMWALSSWAPCHAAPCWYISFLSTPWTFNSEMYWLRNWWFKRDYGNIQDTKHNSQLLLFLYFNMYQTIICKFASYGKLNSN